MCLYIPETINEIVLNKIDSREEACTPAYSTRLGKYGVGDVVRFIFNGTIKRGMITNVLCLRGHCAYHIESSNGVWYQRIYETDIKDKLQK